MTKGVCGNCQDAQECCRPIAYKPVFRDIPRYAVYFFALPVEFDWNGITYVVAKVGAVFNGTLGNRWQKFKKDLKGSVIDKEFRELWPYGATTPKKCMLAVKSMISNEKSSLLGFAVGFPDANRSYIEHFENFLRTSLSGYSVSPNDINILANCKDFGGKTEFVVISKEMFTLFQKCFIQNDIQFIGNFQSSSLSFKERGIKMQIKLPNVWAKKDIILKNCTANGLKEEHLSITEDKSGFFLTFLPQKSEKKQTFVDLIDNPTLVTFSKTSLNFQYSLLQESINRLVKAKLIDEKTSKSLLEGLNKKFPNMQK